MINVEEKAREEGYQKVVLEGPGGHYYTRHREGYGLEFFDANLKRLESWSMNLEGAINHLLEPLERAIRIARIIDERSRAQGEGREASDEIQMIAYTFENVMRSLMSMCQQAEKLLGQRIYLEFPTSPSASIEYDRGFIVNARLASGSGDIVDLDRQVDPLVEGMPEQLDKLKAAADKVNR